ncbi:MAG: cell envelope integrity protein TolA [Bryobacteraceae bacterium]|jgi:hypothetical protein
MKRILAVGLTGTALSFLLFGTAAVAYAQKEKKGGEEAKSGESRPKEGRPAKTTPWQTPRPQPREQQARPEQRQAEHAPQQQREVRPEQGQAQRDPQQQRQIRPEQGVGRYAGPQRTEQQARAWQQQRGWLERGGWQGHDSWMGNRAQRWEAQHRTWGQRGGYGGYFIPEVRFNLYFGRQRFFRIGAAPIILGGYPRFQYGGFWFMLVDPWPENWAENWYVDDDVYIVWDNGYYLYNRRYPGEGIAISVVF